MTQVAQCLQADAKALLQRIRFAVKKNSMVPLRLRKIDSKNYLIDNTYFYFVNLWIQITLKGIQLQHFHEGGYKTFLKQMQRTAFDYRML